MTSKQEKLYTVCLGYGQRFIDSVLFIQPDGTTFGDKFGLYTKAQIDKLKDQFAEHVRYFAIETAVTDEFKIFDDDKSFRTYPDINSFSRNLQRLIINHASRKRILHIEIPKAYGEIYWR